MKKYSNLNRFFGDIIDKKLKDIYHKDIETNNENYLCDIDYIYKNLYNKCSIVSQVNHDSLLGNKWVQYKHFIDWCKKNNKVVPDYIPKTYLITTRIIESNDKKIIDKFKSLFKNNKKWIVKPENASFRAGIQVVNSYKHMTEWIGQYINSNWIIQDYVDNPLTIEGRKMHLRIYVLLIKTKQYAQVLVFNKGYIFLAKTKYNKNILAEDSNLSGGDSKEQMRLYPHRLIKDYGEEAYKKILDQINIIVKDTMDATIDNLSCVNNEVENYKCYKFLGYDILVNSDFKVYLAEINSRTVNVKFPIKNMYENILSIVLDKTKGPLSNDYLLKNKMNFYSVLKRLYLTNEE